MVFHCGSNTTLENVANNTEMKKIVGGNIKFSIRHVEFEMSIRFPSREAEVASGYISSRKRWKLEM